MFIAGLLAAVLLAWRLFARGDGGDATLLLRRACAAMRQGKDGMGGHVAFDARFEADAVRRLVLLRDLRTAIEADRLQAHFRRAPAWPTAAWRPARWRRIGRMRNSAIWGWTISCASPSRAVHRSSVQSMLASAQDAVFVHATSDLAHALGMRVVAEGVDSIEFWGPLGFHGCD